MADEREPVMRRVLVAGISGAGKTTIARRLEELLDLPRHELDALQHGPGWQPRETFERDVRAFVDEACWVTEDQYHSILGDLLWEHADTLVWLDLSRAVVMRRVIARTARRLLARTELYNGNRERWRDLPSRGHPIRWAWSQHARRSEQTAARARRHGHVRVVRLTDPAAVDAWLERLRRGREADTVEA